MKPCAFNRAPYILVSAHYPAPVSSDARRAVGLQGAAGVPSAPHNGASAMAFVTIEHDATHTIAVNTDLITYLRQDIHGTAIHFSSGELIVCPVEMDALLDRLAQTGGDAR